MIDRFLEATDVKTEQDAIKETLKAALAQRQNRVYARDEVANEREEFRTELRRLLRELSQRYSQPTQPISDTQHCEAIRLISDTLSLRFGEILKGGRLRYGTSQKAFNLYLKFLWRMGKAARPPHCPVDGTVLEAAGIIGSWTRSDSEKEYIGWMDGIKRRAGATPLAEWEYGIWLRSVLK
jgi:hypothetical protein